MRLAGALVVGLVAILSAQSAAQTPATTAADLARQLQARYDAIRDFSADFVHTYRGGVLRRETVERGTLLVKKPGKMRWEYTAPERKLFVSNGARTYWYLPEDKQVTISAAPPDSTAATPALFLAGRGSLTRDFDAEFADTPSDQPAGGRALKLTPRTPQDEYAWLVLTVDARSLALRGLLAADAEGGTSSFAFTNLKENLGTPDHRFEFDIPRGVDVVTSQR